MSRLYKISASYALRLWGLPIDEIKAFIALAGFFIVITALLLYKAVLIGTTGFAVPVWTIYGLIVTTFLISRIPYAYLHKDDHSRVHSAAEYPSVSVIIAAKNEEKGIFDTISTCINSRYAGKLECIVIDDGSTDGTRKEMERAREQYGERVRPIIFPQNMGKREAMAVGIKEARHEVIVFVDSDTFLKEDAIHHIVQHFMDDPRIGAVSGNTKVANATTNLLTRMQSIQYAISFDVYKASESVHRSVTCCPGCFSAYRRVAIEPLVHNWKNQKFLGSKGTFGDDRGLTNFVLRTWDIIYCEKARASTIAPERFKVYWRQQLRWKKSWIREGIFAGLFMWKKRHPLASFAFYTNFTFPILGPVLAAFVLVHSISTQNPLIFVVFMVGFALIGMMFAFFVRAFFHAENWLYMPFFSLLFVSVLIWQMPYALITLRKTHWGTR